MNLGNRSEDAELAKGKARIAQLEREAIERSGDSAKALRDHLDRYQALVLAIAQVIWTRDPNGEMVGEQPSWGAYTGQILARYQGRGWLDAVHPDDRALDLELWDRAVVARAPCDYEHRLRRHDGEYRYFSVRAVPVFAEDGAIREWVGIHSDITQRKLMEQSLRDGVRQLRELADAMPTIVWTATPDGALDYYNQRWFDYTGTTIEQTRGWGWQSVLHPDDLQRCVDEWTKAVATGEAFEIKYRFKKWSDGGYRWHLGRAVPARGKDGVIAKWFGTCTDIEDEVLAQSVLRANETRFRELADAMPQIVWGARPDGHFDYYNYRWYEFTGRPAGDWGDANWADVVHPEDQKESLARWHSAILSGDAYEIEYRLKNNGGEYRWCLTRALPVRNPEGVITRWFGTCTDINERKLAEEQLRLSAFLLMQSNRELEEFASVASHDLQEPLRKMQSFVGWLRDGHVAALDAQGRDYLDRIQSAATRMRTLVSDLLEFSRISSKGNMFVPVDLNEVLAGVVSDLEARLVETGGRVETQNLPTVASDFIQMHQLLQNLIGNALKFHRKNEAPIVKVSAELINNHDLNGRILTGATCRISVADNGIGFDEKYLDRVFTLFQRLHGRGDYEGTGIGLALCRRIVERHGGTITARSKPGEGATFIVTMPLQRNEGNHGR